MIYPPLNSLIEKVDSRYTLVVEVAKRARGLIDGDEPLVESDSTKPVSIAINEVNKGYIKYLRPKIKKK